jgi:hypothetical protein
MFDAFFYDRFDFRVNDGRWRLLCRSRCWLSALIGLPQQEIGQKA